MQREAQWPNGMFNADLEVRVFWPCLESLYCAFKQYILPHSPGVGGGGGGGGGKMEMLTVLFRRGLLSWLHMKN